MKTIFAKDDTNAFEQKFLTVDIKNLPDGEVSKAVFRCGKIVKEFMNPTFPLDVDLTSQETALLSSVNTGYMALYDKLGRKTTLEAEITFPARKCAV